MMQRFKSVLLTAILTFSGATVADDLPYPEEDNLANFHLLDETCSGQCHLDESPSDDMEFEYNSCVECHDSLGELKGSQHNLKHLESEQMECVDCHLPHEEFDPVEMCVDCHDEEDEELSDFYSHRIIRYTKQFATHSRASSFDIFNTQ